MQLRHRQRGLGLWGWIYFLGTAGFMVLVGMQVTPVYLAEMAIQRVVKATAEDSGNSSAPVADLRKAMKTRWDVEGITTLKVDDVKLIKHPAGRALSYQYEAKIPLFANAALVLSFAKTYPMKGGGSIE